MKRSEAEKFQKEIVKLCNDNKIWYDVKEVHRPKKGKIRIEFVVDIKVESDD